MLLTAVRALLLLACKLLSTYVTIQFRVFLVLLARMLFVLFCVYKKASVLLQKPTFRTIGALFFGLLLFGLLATD